MERFEKAAGSGLHARLPSLIEAWRGRPGALSPAEIATVSRDLLRLQRGLTGERGLAGAGYMEDTSLLGAYFLYYWPVSYLQVSIALASLDLAVRPLQRVLDLGAGPGPASAACADTGATELFLADRSPRALALAEGFLARSDGPPRVTTATLDLENPATFPPGPFDLIIASHLLNELWKGRENRLERRFHLLETAMDRLAPDGILLLVEPSLLATSRDLLALRDRLAAAGHAILGPCQRQAPCPALAAGPAQTCHAETPWQAPEPVASLARAAGLDRDSVKMTWFAFSRGHAPPAAAETAASSLVVSAAMLNKAGRIRFILCDAKGRYPLSAHRDDPLARGRGFFDLRRYDRIRVAGAPPREAGALSVGEPPSLGFADTTSIEVCSRVLVAPSPGGSSPSRARRRQ